LYLQIYKLPIQWVSGDGEQWPRRVKLTTLLHSVLRLRIRGAIPPLRLRL